MNNQKNNVDDRLKIIDEISSLHDREIKEPENQELEEKMSTLIYLWQTNKITSVKKIGHKICFFCENLPIINFDKEIL